MTKQTILHKHTKTQQNLFGISTFNLNRIFYTKQKPLDIFKTIINVDIEGKLLSRHEMLFIQFIFAIFVIFSFVDTMRYSTYSFMLFTFFFAAIKCLQKIFEIFLFYVIHLFKQNSRWKVDNSFNWAVSNCWCYPNVCVQWITVHALKISYTYKNEHTKTSAVANRSASEKCICIDSIFNWQKFRTISITFNDIENNWIVDIHILIHTSKYW